jgi:hypothetical protein
MNQSLQTRALLALAPWLHGVVACANGARGEEVQGRKSELLSKCKMKPVIFGKGHEGAAHDDVLNLDQGAVRFEELQ